MTTTREYILDEARECIMRDRNLDYDEPERNFQDIATFWNVYLQGKQVIEPHDVGVMCALIKVARIRTSPGKADHYIDAAGYMACAAECAMVDQVEPGQERHAWDWSEFLGDMGEQAHE